MKFYWPKDMFKLVKENTSIAQGSTEANIGLKYTYPVSTAQINYTQAVNFSHL